MKWEDVSDPGILKAVEAAIRENMSMKRISITALCAPVSAKPPKHVCVCTSGCTVCQMLPISPHACPSPNYWPERPKEVQLYQIHNCCMGWMNVMEHLEVETISLIPTSCLDSLCGWHCHLADEEVARFLRTLRVLLRTRRSAMQRLSTKVLRDKEKLKDKDDRARVCSSQRWWAEQYCSACA